MPTSALNVLCVMTIAGSLLLASGPVWAEKLPLPSGDVLLTISGDIENTNTDGAAQFDRRMLERLGLVDVTTVTPWHGLEEMRFSGVPLSVLLDYVGAHGITITAVALDDYRVDIPMPDSVETGVILALKLNGQDMTVKNRGPLFVIYPYDTSDVLDTKIYYARSAWQVARLIIK